MSGRSACEFDFENLSLVPAIDERIFCQRVATGLTKRSWIKISQIRTLSVDRIGRRLARAAEEELARVLDGLNEIVG